MRRLRRYCLASHVIFFCLIQSLKSCSLLMTDLLQRKLPESPSAATPKSMKKQKPSVDTPPSQDAEGDGGTEESTAKKKKKKKSVSEEGGGDGAQDPVSEKKKKKKKDVEQESEEVEETVSEKKKKKKKSLQADE